MANPSARDWPKSALVAARLTSLAVICAALYWGQAVLVPLVLGALLTFLLSPLVTRLDRVHVPRVAGVLLVMALPLTDEAGFALAVLWIGFHWWKSRGATVPASP